jgi:hypothetical protein
VRKSRGFPAWSECGPNIECDRIIDRGRSACIIADGRPTFPFWPGDVWQCFEYWTIDDRW